MISATLRRRTFIFTKITKKQNPADRMLAAKITHSDGGPIKKTLIYSFIQTFIYTEMPMTSIPLFQGHHEYNTGYKTRDIKPSA